MKSVNIGRVFFAILFGLVAVFLPALELTVIGPPGTLLVFENGSEVVIDVDGFYKIEDLDKGDEVRFRAEVRGRYPSDYLIPMGAVDKTFRMDPVPTGTIAVEFKLTDADLCPGFGFEVYPDPEDFYLSIDIYQSFFGFVPLFTGTADAVSTKYFLPMLGMGWYILPFDFPFRLNFGISSGAMFGSNLPSILYAGEISLGLEFKFGGHYIFFVEMNPRFLSPPSGGWSGYSDLFGASRSSSFFDLGGWGFMAFPSTILGFKLKY